jgi:hypothetical protein
MARRLGLSPTWQAARLGAVAAIAITLIASSRAAVAPDAARVQ